mgnify:CR=1 FL=1
MFTFHVLIGRIPNFVVHFLYLIFYFLYFLIPEKKWKTFRPSCTDIICFLDLNKIFITRKRGMYHFPRGLKLKWVGIIFSKKTGLNLYDKFELTGPLYQ